MVGLKHWLVGWLGTVVIAWAPPVQAQSQTSPSPTDPTPAISTRATDLVITPRVGAGYNTSGGGYEGFGSFQGFIPIEQTPGKNLLYLVAQLLLDNDANLGGNLLVGYRAYNPGADRIYGAYLAYDSRDTGNNVFSQLGVGFETLGNTWDARINAYLPIGRTRQTLSDTTFTTGFQLDGFRFQNNFLVASGSSLQTRIRDVEAAMAGFDAEAGGRILRFPNGGDLRGYAGLYYISAGDSAVGVRGRLELRPIDYVTLGLGVQHDGIFGTNVVASVALSFPNTRPQGATPNSVLARMGENPARLNAIVVDRQREISQTTTIVTDTPVQNPTTGQPYVFQHVTLGAGGGNGTFEAPLGSLEEAMFIDGTISPFRVDNNTIIYVQAGSNLGTPGVSIRDGVQVLSSAVPQFIDVAIAGQILPNLQLPLSGLGAPRPRINSTIRMGENTVLSGFDISTTTGPGVVISNITLRTPRSFGDVKIRDNVIQNTAGEGILAGAATSKLTLLRNQINSTGGAGISVSSSNALVIADTQVTNTADAGIRLSFTGNADIQNTIIQNTGSAGIFGDQVSNVTLARNQIIGAQDQGIFLQNVGTATLTDNLIAATRAGTTTIANPITGDITIGSITIPNPGSIIPLPSGQGIAIVTTTGDVNIARNTVTGTGTQGIVLLNARGNASITDNTVANTIGADFTTTVPPLGDLTVTTGQGIVVAGVDGNLEVSRNSINNVRGQGLAIAGVLNGTTTVSSNVIRNTVDQGLVVGGTTGTTTIANNQISGVTTRNVTVINPTGIGPANVTVATGQGLILLNSIGTVNITGNTIEEVDGAASTAPIPPSGQGIAIAAFSGQLDLNIINNVIRQNDNDGVLIGLAGRTTGSVTPATANITISGNTIENNGGAIPVRGDGIGIGVEQDAVVNNLLIENNTIRNNGDEGIDIRLGQEAIPLLNPTTAQLTGTIRNNTIDNNAQNGIQVGARGGTTARVAIESNTISNNDQRGVFVVTSNLPALGTPQISANVRLNTLTANAIAGIEVTTTSALLSTQTICVNLTGNTSTTPSIINNIANPIFNPPNSVTVVDLANLNTNNTGGVVATGTPAPVNTIACP